VKVIVCGAGIAGLALAQCHKAAGTDVVLLEKALGPRSQGYMIDFFGPGYDAAEAMGVLPRILEHGHRARALTYWDAVGRRRAVVPVTRFADVVHERLVSVMRPDLEHALREGGRPYSKRP
jgi:2-polyprenyl-6-methoxyphenol hydroxylase-like FAD-dependent oxidoreductase